MTDAPNPGDADPPHLTARQLFAIRPFAIYWVARFLGTFAAQIISVAVGWQVYDITRDPLDLGIIGLVQFLPMLVLTFVVGHVADQFDRRRIGLICQIIEAGVVGIIALGVWQGWLSKWRWPRPCSTAWATPACIFICCKGRVRQKPGRWLRWMPA